MGKRGQARDIAARFKRDVTDDVEEEGRRKPRREQIVIDLGSGPTVLENEPQPSRPDVVRSVLAVLFSSRKKILDSRL